MIKNQALFSQLESYGFKIDIGKEKARPVKIQASLGAMMALMRNKDTLGFKKSGNRALVNEYFSDSLVRQEFTGGTNAKLIDDISGKMDMSLFFETRKAIENSSLMSKLKTVMVSVSPKRKRYFSEDDGEWDYDRKWEMAPFQAAYHAHSPVKVITFAANFSISSWESAEEITKYGAVAWALSDLIEKAGVQTRIVLSLPNGGAASDRSVPIHAEIELKKPGQYIAPSLLACAFQANFYRRPCFALWACAPELVGREIHYGLGTAVSWPDRIKFEEGILKLSPAIKESFSGSGVYIEELESELIKALGIRK